MLVRRAIFHWLLPAAVVLPLWLLFGWIVFDASGGQLLWVLLIAMPAVFLGDLVLSLLIRARGTVRHARAVSWWDMLVIALWHGLTIAAGTYAGELFWVFAGGATVAFLVAFWSSLAQLFREAQGASVIQYTREGVAFMSPRTRPGSRASRDDVIVVEEARGDMH